MRELVKRTGWAGVAVCVGLAALWSAPAVAAGQSLKDEIVGVWRQVAISNEEHGVKGYPYGPTPVGLAVFDRSGYVISFLAKPGIPKFATNNRLKGTDEEYRTAMQGLIAGFGTYTVDGATVTITWEASSYPNRTGTVEQRTYTIIGDTLRAVNPTASSGGTSYQEWVRVK